MQKNRFTIKRSLRKLYFLNIFDVRGARNAFTAIGAKRGATLLGIFGHAIIVMSLIDLVLALIPPQAQNPVWELETINSLMSQVWFLLVGFALVIVSYLMRYYLDRAANVPVWELGLFKLSRWIVLFIAIVCLLMPPLILVDTLRVNKINTEQITQATTAQLTQLSQAESQLAQVQDINQLRALLPGNITIPSGAPLANLKKELQTSLAAQKQQISTQAATVQGQKRFTLFKTSARNFIAAIIASFCLFAFFWRTRGFLTKA